MHKIGLSSLGSVLMMLFVAEQAIADDNIVYIGQTGFTNSVDIDQLGEANKVGFDAISLNVVQDGANNELTVEQTGYTNEAGATSLTGSLGLQGLVQRGDNNIASITQTNSDLSGQNIIGAIEQVGPEGIGSTTTNALSITQTDEPEAGSTGSGIGTGRHVIGEVQQVNTGSGTTTNSATIAQYDGDSGSGESNRVQLVIQNGQNNTASITQRDEGNQVSDFRQYGSDNQASITQRDGSDNDVTSFLQDGDNNDALLTMTGSRNLIFSIIQGNALIGIAGNIATVTLGGDDNGGDGMGGLGQFQHVITDALEVAQAEIKQLGDENNLNFVTSATSAATQYGFVQEGDGNALSGTVDGTENEAAALQIGDGNRLDFSQQGDQNALALTFRGDDNVVNSSQVGNQNRIKISFEGQIDPITRSNQNNDPALGGFTGDLLANAGSLEPGDIVQTGDLNEVSITVSTGSFNQFAVSQTGQQNIIDGQVSGTSNAALVIQTGNFNTAYYRQSGNNNQLIILQ